MVRFPVNTVRWPGVDCAGKVLDMTYVRRFQRVRVTFPDGKWLVGNRERLVERWKSGRLPGDSTEVVSVKAGLSELVGGVFREGVTLGEAMAWLSDYGNGDRPG